MVSAQEVAKYFLSLASQDEGDFMTNMKLQKLLYYAQGFYLAMYDEPLFPERIFAWTHGPVVAEVYYTYKEYGREPIPADAEFNPATIEFDILEALDDVYDVYGQFTATGLRNLTHKEPPWVNTPEGKEISHEALKTFFKTQLTGDG